LGGGRGERRDFNFFFEFCGEGVWRSSRRGLDQILATRQRGKWKKKLGFLLYCGTSVPWAQVIIFTNAEIFNQKKKILLKKIFL
jgi:hypothetical protein